MGITCHRYAVFAVLVFIAAILVLFYFSTVIAETLHKVFSTSLLVHLLFNFIIVAIVSKERYRASSSNELNTFPTHWFALEEPDEISYSDDDECNVYADDLECGGDQGEFQGSDQSDNDHDYNSSGDDYDGSDGYDEDDDDNGSYGDIWWGEDEEDEEEEEYDSELESRIDAFIAKVINGWKEEWCEDSMQT